MFGAMGLGNAAAFAPDVGKAQVSARRIIYLIDTKPTLDYTTSDGNKLPVSFLLTCNFAKLTVLNLCIFLNDI